MSVTRGAKRARWLTALFGGVALGLAHIMIFATAATAAPAVPGPNGELPDGWVNSQWGPIGPACRALIVGVRRANLWEGPAGQMAAQKGVNPRVREIGVTIGHQHRAELDPATLKLAGILGMSLPTQPSDEQLGWLVEMDQAQGQAFDQVFVDRLRLAHSKVFQLIATVRANARNSLVREFAITANRYVDGHIKFLDSTGLVRYEQLPTPAAPPAGPRFSLAQRGGGGGLNPMIAWAVMIIAVVAAGATTIRILRSR